MTTATIEGRHATVPATLGRSEWGTVSVSDRVVEKIAARAAAENPDAGAATTRVLGVAIPGAGHLGTRSADLTGLPKTTVQVDGGKAFVQLELSVRWPSSVPDVTAAVRSHVCQRVEELCGLQVDEVHIAVTDLVTDLAPARRVH